MNERILVPPREQLTPRGRRASGRLDQSRTVGILPQGDEQLADSDADAVGIFEFA